MRARFRYDRGEISLSLPGETILYESRYPVPLADPALALRREAGGPLGLLLEKEKPESVCIVVSDITRPIPYRSFLPALTRTIITAGVKKEGIFLLIATGMHRPSTTQERIAMFGRKIASEFRIVDHRAEDPGETLPLNGRSASGAKVRLNRHYLGAGFRIVTGLVEPHFMAGFSGGRKALCPGLVSLETVRNFHGARFLSDERAKNANLAGNPLHLEAESIARLAGCEFCVNVVLDNHQRPVRFFTGDIFESHARAADFVREYACPGVKSAADIVITGSGGYPLDATFYQCVKGFVSCLPAVKKGGIILSLGGCREGAGSPEYAAIMKRHSGNWKAFLKHIKTPGVFVKDQWEFQMHCRALRKAGKDNLHFFTGGLSTAGLSWMAVNGHATASLQKVFNTLYRKGMTVAAFPEGPYCAPFALSAQ